MLMLINPFNCYFDWDMVLLDGRKLNNNYTWYILDTDDLSVEGVSYEMLLKYLELGIKIRNVRSTEGIEVRNVHRTKNSYYYINELYGQEIRSKDTKISWGTDFISINNHTMNCFVKNVNLDFSFYVGETELCRKNAAVNMRMQVLYAFRSGDYIVLRIVVKKINHDAYNMVALFGVVFDLNGNIIGVDVNGNNFDIIFNSKDLSFMSKLKIFCKNKY